MKNLRGNTGKHLQLTHTAPRLGGSLNSPNKQALTRDKGEETKMADGSPKLSENANLCAELRDFKVELLASMRKIEREQTDLADKFSTALQPLKKQLEEIQKSLQKTDQKAEQALEIGELLQEENKQIRQALSDLRDKTISMETTQKRNRLKFRGLLENKENPQGLIPFMRQWLAQVMALQDGFFPIILQAYRVGAQHNPKRKGPRDVLVAFADDGVRNDIFLLAKNKGTLKCEEEDIMVFPDIPTEAIQMRRQLKKTTQQLKEAKYKYKWLSSGKLCVIKNGVQYVAWDEDSGEELLHALSEEQEEDMTRKTFKRKLTYPSTPRRDHKIAAREQA